MPHQSQRCIVFTPFTIDLERSTLSRGDEVRALRRQSFDVLRHLAERSGRTVPSAEIVDAIWQTKPAYPDASLAQCIKDIRKALGDYEWMVRTVPGVGYELTPEATIIANGGNGNGSHDQAVQGLSPAPSRGQPTENELPSASATQSVAAITRQERLAGVLLPRWVRERRFEIAAVALAAVVASVWLAWRPGQEVRPAVPTMLASPSVTFLPVSSDGRGGGGSVRSIPDEIAAELRRAPRGFDISINVQGRAEGKSAAAQPQSRYAVATSVSEEAGAQQVLVQLIEAPTGLQLWARPYSRAVGLEGRTLLAARIARELAVAIRHIEGQRPLPKSPQAGHFALMGRLLLEGERGRDANARAMAVFDKGVAADRNHIQSLMGAARTRISAIGNGWLEQSQTARYSAEAKRAIDHIIALNRESVGGHLLRGVLERTNGNFEQSLASLEHARNINPNYMHVHAEIGRTLIDMGRTSEAVDQIKRALELSPTDPVAFAWYYWAGMAEGLRGDFQASLNWLHKSAQANPRYAGVRPWMAVAYARTGQSAQASKVLKEHIASQPRFSVEGWIAHFAKGRPSNEVRLEPLGLELAKLGVPASRPSSK